MNGLIETALPPDVRRRLAPPTLAFWFWGYAPGARFAPTVLAERYEGAKRAPGA
ncbi:MAG: hypothetical protein ABR555_10935 [Pyrinomonadaceae bacterium]